MREGVRVRESVRECARESVCVTWSLSKESERECEREGVRVREQE